MWANRCVGEEVRGGGGGGANCPWYVGEREVGRLLYESRTIELNVSHELLYESQTIEMNLSQKLLYESRTIELNLSLELLYESRTSI